MKAGVIKLSQVMNTRPPSIEDLGEQKPLNYSAIVSQLNFLEGKILTVIDASYTNERQTKAVKDLVKSQFREQISWIGTLCFPETRMVSEDEIRASGEELPYTSE